MEFFDQGRQFFDKGEYDSALKAFEKFVEGNGRTSEGYFWRAMTFRKLENIEKCLEDLELAIALDNNNAEYHSEKGVTHFQEGKIDDAVTSLQKALDLEPDVAYRHSSLAYAQAKAGHLFDAIDHYERAIELDPEDEILHNNLGLLHEQMGYNNKAENQFQKSDKILEKKNPNIKRAKNDTTLHTVPEQLKNQPKKNQDHSFWGTLKGFFTSKEERGGFLKFLKAPFSSKADLPD